MTREEFLANKKIGMMLRNGAPDPKDVPDRARITMEMVDKARGIEIDGQRVISRIDILIPTDKRYKDSDCGETAGFLEKFNPNNGNGFYVTEVSKGDNFCSILNDGMMLQAYGGMDFAIIASSEASSYLTRETMAMIIDAACNGALAIGVAINELTQSICEGRIANTFAMWHIKSLMGVGGFDFRAAKPMDGGVASYLDNGLKPYLLQGVEEVIPLARMAKKFGQCIAPIMPQGEGVQAYKVPNPSTHPEAYAVHIRKMGTKLQRQTAHLASIGYDIDFLKNAGVMPGYGCKAKEV
jgi:hypothetical protein